MICISGTLVLFSAFCCLFVFALYPILVPLFAKRPTIPGERPASLMIVVPFRNKSEQVLAKIENLSSCLKSISDIETEVIFASDQSDDAVVDQVKKALAPPMQLRHWETRVGKTWMVNELFSESDCALLMVTDADVLMDEDTLPRMVDAFCDQQVGSVSATRTVAGDANKSSLELSRLYLFWKAWLKQRESSLGLMIGLEGTGYMVRRDLWIEVDNAGQDDLVLGLASLAAGKSSIQIANALVFDQPAKTERQEFARIRRIVNRAISSLATHRDLWTGHGRGKITMAVFSTKIGKWIFPILLPVFSAWFILALAIEYPRPVIESVSIILAIIGVTGLLVPARLLKLFSVLRQGVTTIAGMAAGIVDYLLGKRTVTWEHPKKKR